MSKSATLCRALQQYDQDELLHIVASLFPEQVQVVLGGTEPKTVVMLARHLSCKKGGGRKCSVYSLLAENMHASALYVGFSSYIANTLRQHRRVFEITAPERIKLPSSC